MKGLCLVLPLLMLVKTVTSHMADDIRHDQDYLQPTDRSDDKLTKYRHLLESKLGITPFDSGRVIMPAGLGGRDASVSIYSQRIKDGTRTYWITSVETNNLWEQTNGVRNIEKAQNVKVRRVDAPIPEKTAQLLKRVWSHMLTHVRAPQAKWIQNELIGVAMDFSIQRNNAAPLRGEFHFKPLQGTRTYALMELSEALFDYSQAGGTKRVGIGTRIERDAKQLLARL